ncbi:MAG: hypothetical protein AVDCRST_MAG40-2159, partial [uncultured Gemmatimonadaceae bacterium]
ERRRRERRRARPPARWPRRTRPVRVPPAPLCRSPWCPPLRSREHAPAARGGRVGRVRV